MTAANDRFASRYRACLLEFMRSGSEDALERAYELGRAAMSEKRGLLDVLAVHAAVAETPEASVSDAAQRQRFLAEALSPYEMALRGFSEANFALKRLSASLEQRVRERTRELMEAQRLYQRLLEEVPALIYTIVPEARVVLYVSPQVEHLFGYLSEEWSYDFWLDRIHPDDVPMVLQARRSAVESRSTMRAEYRVLARDGSIRWLRDQATASGGDGAPISLRGIAVDATEARSLAEQFHEAQRLESVGRLAGGIAHDFNNLIAVILTNADLALEGIASGEPVEEEVHEIHDAARRAGDLTRQLLAFSRRQVLHPRLFTPNALVRDIERMLRRLIGGQINLSLDLDPELGLVRADPGQLEQVIMNLVVNARDAIAGSGHIEISTSRRRPSPEERARHRLAVSGEHARISVSDDGNGIPPEVRQRIFEPFFTTKDVDQGTGLGLSTCRGIIEQSGGVIEVHSEVGRGTRFDVLLPLVDEPSRASPVHARLQERASPRPGTILVVEDDPALRRSTARLLRQAGHEALLAADAMEALATLAARCGKVDVVLTDVIMQGMNGRELQREVAQRFPEVQIVLMTGYASVELLRVDGGTDLDVLHKPFDATSLLAKVHRALSRASSEGGEEA